MKLSAFFYYYGAKNALARSYPAPEHGAIIEPFAGSAAYSLAYPDRRVELFDLDERIVGVWHYLIKAPESEILALPDPAFDVQISEMPIVQEARWLIGFLVTAAASEPKGRWSQWARDHLTMRGNASIVWSQQRRQLIARQQRHIRHWRITHASWETAPITDATYFVDPPYQVAGKHYRCGARDLDFEALGSWCQSLPGQVIACEAEGATWLPFRPLLQVQSQGRTGEKKGAGKSREVVWTNRQLTRCHQTQMLDLLDPDRGAA